MSGLRNGKGRRWRSFGKFGLAYVSRLRESYMGESWGPRRVRVNGQWSCERVLHTFLER